MPYQLYQVQYSSNPLLLVGEAGSTPTYRHEEMRRFFVDWAVERYERTRSRLVADVPLKVARVVFYLLGVGIVSLIGLPGIAARPSLRFVFVTTSAVVGATLLTAGSFPHYAAPVAPLLYVGLGAALAHLHRKGRRTQSINVTFVSVFLLVTLGSFYMFQVASQSGTFSRSRASLVRALESLPDKSLVFVKYGPTHNLHEEWVQNLADIDGSKVVWARSMSAARNQQLIDYFPGRKAWSLEPDNDMKLKPYSLDAAVEVEESQPSR
jgi:hypothetical protein